ncbi:head-binding domain-containing protein [Escherichia phage vB_EcoM_50EP]|nr:head-binding domain-containing protein [Escherichia phage vB_EcoM_50EP]
MAIYDLGTASLAANGEVNGVGTTWKAPLTLIRVGATIVFKTEPVQIYTISEIISDTQINVYNPNSETVPAGTGYAILAHDGITVQGLAQDVAETLRYYQSRETEVADAVDAFNNFDANDFDAKVSQVNTQHSDVVTIGTQVSIDSAKVTEDKNAAAQSASSAEISKNSAAASAQEAADAAASLNTDNLVKKNDLSSAIGATYVGIGQSDVYDSVYLTPEQFSGSDDNERIDACLSMSVSTKKRAWFKGNYQINRTIHVPIGVYVQLDGLVEIMADVDGFHLSRESKLIGNGEVRRSASLANYTSTAVILYSPRNGRTVGCIDNIVSDIRITNGWIDYTNDSFGIVTDVTKMTGRGLCLLAGSWGEGKTQEKSNEYCWKNKVDRVFIEGFEKAITQVAYSDDGYTIWNNSNKFNEITTNRCKYNIRIENPGASPNGSLKVEISANTYTNTDIQWYPGITEQYVFCSGRQNTFNFHAWDLPNTVKVPVVVFDYTSNTLANPSVGFSQPRDNVVQVTGLNTESTNRSCDRYGTWMFERFQGQNRVIQPGALTQNFIPEDTAANTHSPLTNHYIAVADDCLLYSIRRLTNPTTVSLTVNGSSSSLTNAGRMFSPLIGDIATTPVLSNGDSFELRVNFPSASNVRFAGFTFGELTWANSYNLRLRIYNASNSVIFDRSIDSTKANTFITGHIEANSASYMVLSVNGITTSSSGVFPICRCFMKAANYAPSGYINPSMSTPFIEDVSIDKANGGVIVWTPDGTKRYKISVTNAGSLQAVLV